MAPVASLRMMAERAAARYIRQIDDLGDIPYDFVRKAMLNITSAEQLHRLEQNSPQIIGHDAEVWCKLIKRDAPHFDPATCTPKDPGRWWKVHRKFTKEAKEMTDAKTRILAERLGKRREERDNSRINLIDKHTAPSRTPRRPTEPSVKLTGGRALLQKVRRDAAVTKRAGKTSWNVAKPRLGKLR